MPARSKAQFRLMKGIAEGGIKPRKGLPSRKEAAEFVEGQSPKGLPERVKKRKKKSRY
jgi:hypothetical protein